jgi:hypothetical protein
MGHLVQLSVAASEQHHRTLALSRPLPYAVDASSYRSVVFDPQSVTAQQQYEAGPYADDPTHTPGTDACQQGVDALHYTAQLHLYAVIYDRPERRLQPHGQIAPSAGSQLRRAS